MDITQEQVDKINGNFYYGDNQGIFIEPFGCDGIKERVVYMRWITGGVTGGSCWGTEHYSREPEKKPQFKALDLVLKELKPDLTFLQFREVEWLIKSTDKHDFGDYYGNCNYYGIEYIKLSDLIEKLNEFNNENPQD